MSNNRSSNTVGPPPRSAGGISIDNSENGSVLEEEYTTALPAFSKEKEPKDRERKDRGITGVLRFPRKRKDKEKGKDRDRSADRNRSGSALGENQHGSLRAKGSQREKHERGERTEDL